MLTDPMARALEMLEDGPLYFYDWANRVSLEVRLSLGGRDVIAWNADGTQVGITPAGRAALAEWRAAHGTD